MKESKVLVLDWLNRIDLEQNLEYIPSISLQVGNWLAESREDCPGKDIEVRLEGLCVIHVWISST